MRAFLLGGMSGWLSVFLLVAVAMLPYVLRPTKLGRRFMPASAPREPYLRRMQPHYWLAYAATALSFVHAWMVMSRGRMPRTSMTGLYIATAALLWLVVQAATGLTLQQRALAGRKGIRRWHFWSMAGILTLV